MKLPRRSLAYGWAKARIWTNEPKWLPALLVAVAVPMFALALWKREEARGCVMWGVLVLAAAYTTWERIGTQEVIEDLERRLEEAQNKKDT